MRVARCGLQLCDKAGDTRSVLPVALAVAQGGGGGTDPWLVVGVALIAATAALLGAVIAARTAGTRQKEQLAHEERRQTKALDAEQERHDATLAAEQDRLEATLEAERQRHAAQLRHQERQQDLEELRRVFDRMMEELHSCFEAQAEAWEIWKTIRAEPDSSEHAATLSEAIERLKQARERLASGAHRLAFRLGQDHEVYDVMGKILNRIDASRRLMEYEVWSKETTGTQYADAIAEFRRDTRRLTDVAYAEIRVRRDAD